MEIWVPRVLKGGKREGSKARGEAQGHEEEEKKNKIKNKINIFANDSPNFIQSLLSVHNYTYIPEFS